MTLNNGGTVFRHQCQPCPSRSHSLSSPYKVPRQTRWPRPGRPLPVNGDGGKRLGHRIFRAAFDRRSCSRPRRSPGRTGLWTKVTLFSASSVNHVPLVPFHCQHRTKFHAKPDGLDRATVSSKWRRWQTPWSSHFPSRLRPPLMQPPKAVVVTHWTVHTGDIVVGRHRHPCHSGVDRESRVYKLPVPSWSG